MGFIMVSNIKFTRRISDVIVRLAVVFVFHVRKEQNDLPSVNAKRMNNQI